MIITKIKIENFRNYEQEEFELSAKRNVFYGDNAQGKTNILEAIFLCSLGKSFRTKKDQELIRIGQTHASVEIEYEKSDRSGKIQLEVADKKTFWVNGIKIKKLSDLLGNIYIVLFNPNDIDILKNGPSSRRRFLDIMISQLKVKYIYYMNEYARILEQRNTYLRQIKYENKNETMLSIWDERLAEIGEKIYQYRSEFLEKIKGKINQFHGAITKNTEILEIEYLSSCKEKSIFLETLRKNREEDIAKGYTKAGIHRDDFTISINGKSVSVFGSQGQQRTAIISLKLSELEVIYDEIGEYPILLLDDFMSELDDTRIQNLLEKMKENQVIITCTDNLKVKNQESKCFHIQNGRIVQD